MTSELTTELIFLGTGGAFTDFRHNYHNNAIVRTTLPHAPDRFGDWVMIDCGGTAVQSLKELHMHAADVPYVAITHCHGDHVGGFDQLIWERTYTSRNGFPGFQKTFVCAPIPVMCELRNIAQVLIGDYTNKEGIQSSRGVDDLINWEPASLALGDAEVEYVLPGFTCRWMKVRHVVGEGVDKPSYSLHLESNDGEPLCWYSSDTTFNEDMIRMHLYDYDVPIIFHDCTFRPRYPSTVHTHYEELIQLDPEIRSKICLMHHGSVPSGINVEKDGFYAAAGKHDKFVIKDGIVQHWPAGTYTLDSPVL